MYLYTALHKDSFKRSLKMPHSKLVYSFLSYMIPLFCYKYQFLARRCYICKRYSVFLGQGGEVCLWFSLALSVHLWQVPPRDVLFNFALWDDLFQNSPIFLKTSQQIVSLTQEEIRFASFVLHWWTHRPISLFLTRVNTSGNDQCYFWLKIRVS